MDSKIQLSKVVIHGRGETSRHTAISQSWLGPQGSGRFISTMTQTPNNSYIQPSISLAHWNLAKCLVGTNTTSELELPVYLPGKTSILIPPQEHVLCKMVSRARSFWMGSILSTAFQSTVFHFRLVCAPKFFCLPLRRRKETSCHMNVFCFPAA